MWQARRPAAAQRRGIRIWDILTISDGVVYCYVYKRPGVSPEDGRVFLRPLPDQLASTPKLRHQSLLPGFASFLPSTIMRMILISALIALTSTLAIAATVEQHPGPPGPPGGPVGAVC